MFSLSGGADFIFIPERPPASQPWEDAMCAEIQRVGFHRPSPLVLGIYLNAALL
jgi:hypothetical protein